MFRNTLLALGALLTTASCATPKNAVCDYAMFVPINCEVPPEAAKTSPRIASASGTLPSHDPAQKEPLAPQTGTPAAAAPAPVPEIPPVNAVYFGVGESDLTLGSKLTLGAIGDYLKAVKAETIKVAGYTDPTGSVATNKALADKRAKNVIAALTALGIEQSRITYIPVDSGEAKALPQSEYWRLRKVAILYGADSAARIEAQEAAEDAHAENDIVPDKIVKKKKPRPPQAKVDPKEKEEEDVGGVGPEEKKKLETIDVIYWRSVNHALFILAKQLGYFEQEGFNVRLHESRLEANELAIKLADSVGVIKTVRPNSAMDVKNRKYFIGAVCPYGYHEALSKKLPFVSIGSMLTIPSTMIMKKSLYDDLHRDIKSFRGNTLGRISVLATEFDQVYLFTDRLRQAGLKEGTDFNIKVYKDESALYDALFRGEIATALAHPPEDVELTNRHKDYVLYPLSTLNLNLPCCRQVVTRDNLKNNRPKYVRFERAVLRAQRYLMEHPVESMGILAKFLNINIATVRSFMQRAGFNLTANPNAKGAIAFANIMKVRLGAKEIGDVQEAMDTSVYEDALTSLLKEEPDSAALQSMLSTYNRTR